MILMQIPAKRGGAIPGRVMYADGDPAIGVSYLICERLAKISSCNSIIFVAMAMSQTGGSFFKTDDRGVYQMSGLPEAIISSKQPKMFRIVRIPVIVMIF